VAPGDAAGTSELASVLGAASAGDTLLLKPGFYEGTYVLPFGVSLIGVAGPDSTILDAGGGRYVFIGRNLDATTLIAGLTLQNGRRDHPSSGGGGIFLYQSSPRILDNIFRGHLGYLGPGVYANHRSNPVVAFNVFLDNEGYLGGAIAAYIDSSPLIYNNIFIDNRGVSGGAVLCLDSAPVIRRNTIVANLAGREGGSAIYLNSSPALIEDNVIAHNQGSAALYCLDNDRPATVRRNLFWENVGGASEGECQEFLGKNHNVRSDPFFRNLATRDLRRRDSSPAGPTDLPGAGIVPWDLHGLSEIPPSELEIWAEWLSANARE
jgi:hypothetical protein